MLGTGYPCICRVDGVIERFGFGVGFGFAAAAAAIVFVVVLWCGGVNRGGDQDGDTVPVRCSGRPGRIVWRGQGFF